MVTTEAMPLSPNEYQTFSPVDPKEIDMLMGDPATREEAAEAVRPLKQRKTDRIILYHPDQNNPSSVYIVPMNATERRFVIQRLLQKTVYIDGVATRWNYPTPQFEALDLPLRCFVAGCQRRGGFLTRAQLITHVQGKHSNEAPMYAKLIESLMEAVYKDIPPEQYAMYGLESPDGASSPKIETEQLTRLKESLGLFVCDECGANFGKRIALAGHKRSHKEGAE